MTPSPVVVGSVWEREDRKGRIQRCEVVEIIRGGVFPIVLRRLDTGDVRPVMASSIEQRWRQVRRQAGERAA